MSEDELITLGTQNIKNSNELKKKTGEQWRKSSSPHLELKNFDFTKKIFFHPEKIVEYKEGKRPFPTTIEIDLTNRCNHRCTFCFYAEHIGVEADKPNLDTEIIKKVIQEAKILGTKAISFTGGGEPTLHKDYADIVKHTKNVGLDVGTITNGSAITPRNVNAYFENLQWIRISMAGGDRESYQQVQGVDQFDLVLKNIILLSEQKSLQKSNLNIGIRTLVTPNNIDSLIDFANKISSLNINYYQLAPDQYSTDKGAFWNSEHTQDVFNKVKNIITPTGINLLTTTYMESQEGLDYPQTCYAHFFMFAILAEGNVTFCKNARGAENFYIGNIYKNSLKEIWEGDKTKDIEKWVRPNNCGLMCKHMAINNSMEGILHPESDMSPNFVG